MYILDYNQFLSNRDPQLLRNLQSGWGDDHPEGKVDPLNPFPAPYQGFIREEFVIDGIPRSIYALIPPHYPSSGPAFRVFLDDDTDACEFLASSPWVTLADEVGFVLVVIAPGGKWDLTDGAAHERKLLAAWDHFEYLQQIFITGFSKRYLVGYGSGGTVASYICTASPASAAALIACGMEDIDASVTASIGAQPSAVPDILKKDISVAAWLIGKDTEPANAVQYFRASGCCDDFVGTGGMGNVYRPDLRYYRCSVNDVPLWEVIGASAAELPAFDSEEFFSLLFKFAFTFARGFGNTCNAPYIAAATPDELNLIRETAVIDGKMREWWIYIPDSVKKLTEHSDVKVPMVMAMHGYSGNGKDYITEWEIHKIARERNFIVVAPTGYRGAETVFRNGRAMQPQWNGHMEWKDGDTDDVHCIDVIMDHVLQNYPIDPGRCFLTGVSNGAMIVCKAMFMLTHRFAAYLASSGNMNDTHTPDENILPMDLSVMPHFTNSVRAACWIAKGEFDFAQKGMDTTLEPGKSNYEILKRVASEDDIPFEKSYYRENGVWQNTTWLDKDGFPILRFSLGKGYPHGFPAELAWQMWDDFFCHFFRKPDGTLVYTP